MCWLLQGCPEDLGSRGSASTVREWSKGMAFSRVFSLAWLFDPRWFSGTSWLPLEVVVVGVSEGVAMGCKPGHSDIERSHRGGSHALISGRGRRLSKVAR